MIMNRIKEIAEQAGLQNGCRLYDILKNRDGLQVFIDRIDKKRVGLEDCEKVFHSLSFLLRSEFPDILEKLRLEISSPGIERRLREDWHFEESIGELVKISTKEPVLGRQKKENREIKSSFTMGRLISLKDGQLKLENKDSEWIIPLEKIKSSSLVFSFDKNSKNQNL